MSERNCALNSKAYLALKEVYEDRLKPAREWKANGGKTVWTLGCDIPDEIVISAGMLPVRTFGLYGDQPMSDKYLEMSFGPVWRGLFERIVSGVNADLIDHLAISRSSDMLVRIFYYLRELKRFEPQLDLPDMTFLDQELILGNDHSKEWNESNNRIFLKKVEEWSGMKITEEKLSDAIAVCNDNRRALAQFAALRYGEGSRVTGSEALTVIGASLFMDKKENTRLVKELIKDAENWPVVDAEKLFYVGSVQENTEVYSEIEALGWNVVSEDHDWGDRHFDGITDADREAVTAITERIMMRSPSGEQSLVENHCRSVLEKVKKCGADAVIIYMNFNDEAYFLEFPTMRDMLKEYDIPVLCVTKQTVPMKDKEGFANALNGLAGQLKGGK